MTFIVKNLVKKLSVYPPHSDSFDPLSQPRMGHRFIISIKVCQLLATRLHVVGPVMEMHIPAELG